jgi:formylglycine-generating enzyme required for sulfatase activity
LARVEREVVNSLRMKFVLIPAGQFLMGSPPGEPECSNDEQQHKVEITEPFYLGVHQVTQAQWRAVMGSNPSWFCATGSGKDKVRGMDTDDFPVEHVRWQDAQDFLEKLSALKQGPAEKNSLPLALLWPMPVTLSAPAVT